MEPAVAAPKPASAASRHAPLAALAGAGAVGLAALAAWAFLSPEGAGAFLERHFLAPLHEQAALTGSPQYTMPALLGYGSILAVALGLLHELLIVRARLRFDFDFVIALAPFFLWGPLARALENSGYPLRTDLQPVGAAYLVTEPLVYVTTAALAVAALLWARAYGAIAQARPPAHAIAAHAAVLLLIAVVQAALLANPALPYRPPTWWLGVGALAALGAHLALRKRFPIGAPAASAGVLLLWPLLVLTGAWSVAASPPWPAPTAWAGNHPIVIPVAVGGALACALAAVALARLLARAFPAVAAAGSSMAGALVFAHALDALSTIVALRDPFGWGLPPYGEQNPVSDFFLGYFDGWPFLAVKVLLASTLAVVIRDAARENDGEGGPLAGMLAVAVFALGFGPGARNLARLAMGV